MIAKMALLVVALASTYLLWPTDYLPYQAVADRVVVYKAGRRLELWSGRERLAAYPVALGGHPVGHKQRQGDSRTPEGRYFIDSKSDKSGFYLNLGISYPNQADRARADDPGGDIKIHGLKNGYGWVGRAHRWWDWTDGCIAVTNAEMGEIYRAVPVGTPITIYP